MTVIRPTLSRLVFLVLAYGFLNIACVLAAPLVEKVEWQTFADDLELAQVRLSGGTLLNGELVLFRTSLARYRVAVVRAADFHWQRASVKSLCAASHGILCINANFFDEKGEALGLVVSRGITFQKIHGGGKTLSGVFEITRSGPRILNRSEFIGTATVEAVQAGPRLLENGIQVSGLREIDTYSRRSGVCIDGMRRLVVYATSSSLVGVSIRELLEVLRHESIKCRDALNLDGGGSTQLYVSSAAPSITSSGAELFLAGRDDIPVALALFVANK